MTKQDETTLEKLEDVRRFYIDGPHDPVRCVEAKLTALIEVLIQNEKCKGHQKMQTRFRGS